MLSDKRNIPWFGDTIYLRCVARGVPVPNVTWYGLNGSILVNGTSYHPGTSTLMLRRLNGLNTVMYSCLAKNRYGTIWHNVTVTRYCSCSLTEQKKKKPKNCLGLPTSILCMLIAILMASNALLMLILFKAQRALRTKGSKEKTDTVELTSTNYDSTCSTSQLVLHNFNSEPPKAFPSDSSPNTNKEIQGNYQALSDESFKTSPGNYEHLDSNSREQHHPSGFQPHPTKNTNKDVQGNYQELTGGSFKMSQEIYEHLDSNSREHNRPKGFQTFGNHNQSSYEQLQQATPSPVYQRLYDSNNMKNCL